MRVTLRVTDGPYVGQAFSFQGHDTFLVGRSRRAHLRLPPNDRYFSRIHFLVEINPPQIRLMDMESRNHTYVNGQQVGTIDLKDGDVIKAGHTVFQVSVSFEENAPQPSGVVVAPRPTTVEQARSSGSNPSLPTLQGLSQSIGGQSAPGYTYAARSQQSGGGLIPPVAPMPQPLPGRYPLPPPAPPEGPLVPPSSPTAPVPAVDVPQIIPTCLCCTTPLPGGDMNTVESQLCPPCLELARAQQQIVPGYRILKELGRGGMGIVSLACREDNFLLVAMKTITPAVDGNQAEVQKFLREAEILKQLDHPNIVKFQGMGQDLGRLWFAMDYIRGTDARKLVKSQGPLPVQRAVRLVCHLLEALEYAHDRGFVHRDIKPANLLVTERAGREVALLADFGLARVYQASQLSGLTMTGAIGGTPLFMAPEQITAYREAKPPVDQYAAGMTLYNLLTGSYAYNTSDQFRKWVQMVLEAEPTPIHTFRPDLPPGLTEIVHRALQKEPGKRFANARAMRQALLPYA